jgi:hypothetical protein
MYEVRNFFQKSLRLITPEGTWKLGVFLSSTSRIPNHQKKSDLSLQEKILTGSVWQRYTSIQRSMRKSIIAHSRVEVIHDSLPLHSTGQPWLNLSVLFVGRQVPEPKGRLV